MIYFIIVTFLTFSVCLWIYNVSYSYNRVSNIVGALLGIVLVFYVFLPLLLTMGHESIPHKSTKMHYNPVTNDVWAEFTDGEKVKVEHSYGILDSISALDKRYIYENVRYTLYGNKANVTYTIMPRYVVRK